MRLLLRTAIFVSTLFVISAAGQEVVVTSKKVLYHRPKPMADFKKTFTVDYPKVKAATPALSKKIEDAISFDRNLPLRLKEQMIDDQWLDEAAYEVVYNKSGALAIKLSVEGSAAYPDRAVKTVVVDTKTGLPATPATQFTNVAGLVTLIRTAMRKEIDQAIIDIKKDPEAQEPHAEELFRGKTFGVKNLDGFSIGDEGITFTYNYNFPHVIRSLEPAGEFKFTWAEIKPYIRRGSLLSRVAH